MEDNKLSTIFAFKDNTNNMQMFIYACSYLDAKKALLQYSNADNDFDFNKYNVYKIDTDKLFDVLGLDKCYTNYQYRITDSQFKSLKKHFIDSKKGKNVQTLTRNLAESLMNTTDSQLLTTKEYVNRLSEYTESLIKTKHEILQMLKYVGDIWFIRNNDKIVYGKSRYQVSDDPMNYPKLLIEALRYEDISQSDINRYNEMKRYIIEYNAKKFPFIIDLKK